MPHNYALSCFSNEALKQGKTVYMGVPRLSENKSFVELDPRPRGIYWEELNEEKRQNIPELSRRMDKTK